MSPRRATRGGQALSRPPAPSPGRRPPPSPTLPVPMLGQVADLSTEALRARREAERKTGKAGGFTGADLIRNSAAIYDEANRLRKVAARRRRGARRDKAESKADQALVTAAAQIRVAAKVPLDRGYLHAVSVKQIDQIRRAVVGEFGTDPARLAVDTFKRIRTQKLRVKTGGQDG